MLFLGFFFAVTVAIAITISVSITVTISITVSIAVGVAFCVGLHVAEQDGHVLYLFAVIHLLEVFEVALVDLCITKEPFYPSYRKACTAMA